jgi:lipoic acid synthetase
VTLRVRWLGPTRYRDAHALQHALFDAPPAGPAGSDVAPDDWLLLLEHAHVFTLGVRADPAHVLVPGADLGAELVPADRGGDVTYHGPGQLVGYPIVAVPGRRGGGMADTRAYVHAVEQLLIDVLADLGLPSAGRVSGRPGVWLDGDGEPTPRKIAAIGVRLARGRSMHGFALNVDPELSWFDRIVPCGLDDASVTSMAAEGVRVPMRDVVDRVAARAAGLWGHGGMERQDAAWARTDDTGTPVAVSIGARKPAWLRAPAHMGPEFIELKRTMRSRDLVTVCEEAGCPNIFECWSAGTATFMLNGDRCTRACGFCLVDTRRPLAIDRAEPARVADAVAEMGLGFAVLTAVARDDLSDGGAAGFAATIRAIRERAPGTRVEVLIPDCKGDPDALETIFAAGPDVLNHNVETVPRLQRRVRPSASFARSLAVLARARAAGLTTKSGLMVGLGETADEVVGVLADLRGAGVDIVTIGQYLRPTAAHLPVARWWTPDELAALKVAGEALGIGHVEAAPLARSSYHAAEAAEAAHALS